MNMTSIKLSQRRYSRSWLHYSIRATSKLKWKRRKQQMGMKWYSRPSGSRTASWWNSFSILRKQKLNNPNSHWLSVTGWNQKQKRLNFSNQSQDRGVTHPMTPSRFSFWKTTQKCFSAKLARGPSKKRANWSLTVKSTPQSETSFVQWVVTFFFVFQEVWLVNVSIFRFAIKASRRTLAFVVIKESTIRPTCTATSAESATHKNPKSWSISSSFTSTLEIISVTFAKPDSDQKAI